MADFMVFADPEDLSQAAAKLFMDLSHRALGLRGRFVVALSGGSTPRRLLEILAAPPYKGGVPWDRTILFWGDDRMVQPDHEWSNYKLAKDALLDHVRIPEANILRIKSELGPEEAAEAMRRDMVNVFGDRDIPRFDLVLQGMGDDGHTASLFPGTDALDATEWVVPVINPPADPKVDRVTLTFPVLNAARTALFLAAGQGKRDKVREIMNDPTAPDRYPAARLEAEKTYWYLDEAALGEE